jgi:hypothetical protein
MKLNFWDFEQWPIFTGIFVGVVKNVGIFHKPVFVFKKGRVYHHIWGTTIILKMFYDMPFKSNVKITYLGKDKTADSKYPVKLFKIEKTY